MAPGAELFLATTATTAETQAAIDWFVANGVHIITRSLGAPYDGPGDGTGPLDAVVDYAAARGITWFNSGGNDAASGYGRYTDGVDASGYVDFDNGPGVDTVLRIDPSQGGVAFDGIRWANDWYLPAARSPTTRSRSRRAPARVSRTLCDRRWTTPQTDGAPPLEAVDDNFVRRVRPEPCSFAFTPTPTTHPRSPTPSRWPRSSATIEAGRQSARSARPNPWSTRATLHCSPSAPSTRRTVRPIAFYSSQGPTNDGRIKPDISAPSCVGSTVYPSVCFNGTSAASPAAAGMAALLLGQGLALPGMPLAALTRHLVHDLGPPGPDNAYGAGEILLPAAPVASLVCAQHVQRPRRAGSPARHPPVVVRRSRQLDRSVSAVLDRRSADLVVGCDPLERNGRRRQRHVHRIGQPVLRAGAADPRRRDRRLLDDERHGSRPDPPELRHRAARAGFDLDLHSHRRQHHRRRDGLLHAVGGNAAGRYRAGQPTPCPRHPPDGAWSGARRLDRPPTGGR